MQHTIPAAVRIIRAASCMMLKSSDFLHAQWKLNHLSSFNIIWVPSRARQSHLFFWHGFLPPWNIGSVCRDVPTSNYFLQAPCCISSASLTKNLCLKQWLWQIAGHDPRGFCFYEPWKNKRAHSHTGSCKRIYASQTTEKVITTNNGT